MFLSVSIIILQYLSANPNPHQVTTDRTYAVLPYHRLSWYRVIRSTRHASTLSGLYNACLPLNPIISHDIDGHDTLDGDNSSIAIRSSPTITIRQVGYTYSCAILLSLRHLSGGYFRFFTYTCFMLGVEVSLFSISNLSLFASISSDSLEKP